MKKLFGTDGIRGVAGKPPLDPATIFATGLCVGRYFAHQSSGSKILIGEDTRESSRWIAETIAAGCVAAGCQVTSAGVISTPGTAFLTKSRGFAAGIMISASHNPYQDNGIKIFSSSGFKLSDATELAIEQDIAAVLHDAAKVAPQRCPLMPDASLSVHYIQFLQHSAGAEWKLPGWKIVVDCANGSASALAGKALAGHGMKLLLTADQPNGVNINLQCGSLHLDGLRSVVLREKADLGIAFDGDADRALFVSSSGRIVDGDGVMLAASRYLRAKGKLANGIVVGTLMSNFGLEQALAREGLQLLRAPVGDRYVLEEMQRTGASLGGEQSGHIIFLDIASSGDGLLTALLLLRILSENNQSLDDLVRDLAVLPQVIRNVKVRQKVPLEELPQVMDKIHHSQEQLGKTGRIVVRYSGTEPLLRVMVEAATEKEVEIHASAIVRAIEESLGVA
ncbi:MAG: phosphoglucosamine mutase [Acidobacteria bacterium RIFCSPLOWO2_12_FULL_54_10]|nr:MAG: phosphoglucosamine mutase [Acidobacteria bacterium RIFCSPLOWO2_12_FULL_54_10]